MPRNLLTVAGFWSSFFLIAFVVFLFLAWSGLVWSYLALQSMRGVRLV